MPEIKKRNATLSNLLRYPSPKSDKRTGDIFPSKAAQSPNAANRVLMAYPTVDDLNAQVQVRIDGGQTQIFNREQQNLAKVAILGSAISPILSEGSQYSQ